MNLQFVESLENEWIPFVNYLQSVLDQMANFVTVNVSGPLTESCEPYVQAGLLPDNSLILEAVSD